jgi:hypothetical protein
MAQAKLNNIKSASLITPSSIADSMRLSRASLWQIFLRGFNNETFLYLMIG